MSDFKDNIQEEMQRLLDLAKSKKKENGIKKFSGDSIKNISRSIDQPINGILAYLAKISAAFYGKVECRISGHQITTLQYDNYDEFPELLHILSPIEPRTLIDIDYFLIQPNEEFDIKSINEKISIYFDHEFYELGYLLPGNDDKRFRLTYDENVSVEQITTLRNWLSESVKNKVATMIGG